MDSSRSSRSSSPADERYLIESWNPEPLVPDICEQDYEYLLKPHIVTSKPGRMIEVDGKMCLNAGTHNYLNLADSPRLEEASLKAVRKYGVGSCGPRAFYGTMDVHLELEEAIARFLKVQEAVLYSFGFSTIASAIPAYAKATDVVFLDEQCNFAIQQGVVAARSRAIKFKHNNVLDLKKKIFEVFEEQSKKTDKKKKNLRTFLIVESIYAKTGDMCPLREFIDLTKQYKIRLFMDESRSFGILGDEGKGITQHLKVNIDDIDLIMVSLENALCSFGGFCAGSTFIIDHQRLAGTGYCFSASLPPFQCSAALESLKMIEENPLIVKKAQDLFTYAHDKLNNLTYLSNISHPLSPIKILVVKQEHDETEQDEPVYSKEDERKLERICNDILNNDQIAISMSRYLENVESTKPVASIRLIINAGMSHVDIDRIFSALDEFAVRHLT